VSTLAQRHEGPITDDHHTSHRHFPLKFVRLTRQRASGAMERSGLPTRTTKKLRPLLLAAMIVFSIAAVGLHVVGGLVLLKTGLGGLSLSRPLAYLLIGLFAIVAGLKLKHVVGVMHRKEKRKDAGED